MNKKLLCFIGGALLLSQVHAQEIKPIIIGAKCPDIPLYRISESGDSSHVYAFKGKFILLEFWATWCSSCIEHFPEVAKLQQQNKDSLQIVMATYQPYSRVAPFLQKWETDHNISMSGVIFTCADTLLRKYFPYKYFSTEVWISPNDIFLDKGISFIPIEEKAHVFLRYKSLFRNFF